jgi:hypothetical protein
VRGLCLCGCVACVCLARGAWLVPACLFDACCLPMLVGSPQPNLTPNRACRAATTSHQLTGCAAAHGHCHCHRDCPASCVLQSTSPGTSTLLALTPPPLSVMPTRTDLACASRGSVCHALLASSLLWAAMLPATAVSCGCSELLEGSPGAHVNDQASFPFPSCLVQPACLHTRHVHSAVH